MDRSPGGTLEGMTRRQRAALLALAVAVIASGAAAVLLEGDDRAEVTADAATTSSLPATTTTSLPPTTSTSGRTTAETSVPSAQAPATGPQRRGPATTTSTTAAPSVMRTPEPTAPAPPFAASIEPVSAEQLGSSWRAGCPVGPEQLRAVEVSHWGFDGAVHEGRVIVDAAHAERVIAALRDVYDARFPIERMEPVDRYGSDDQASMRANNTSAFNCRYVSGSTTWSEHTYGRAIDINPLVNPYVKGSTVDPPEGAAYADRSRDDPGMIHADDAVVRAFQRQGWAWGGYWSSGQDYQHFSASGR